jgi:hypothetical protein
VVELRADCGNGGIAYQAEAGREVTFNGSASTSPNGIATYEWNFGDDTTGAGITVVHVYKKRTSPPRTKDYDVTLKITDRRSQTAECKTTCRVTKLY